MKDGNGGTRFGPLTVLISFFFCYFVSLSRLFPFVLSFFLSFFLFFLLSFSFLFPFPFFFLFVSVEKTGELEASFEEDFKEKVEGSGISLSVMKPLRARFKVKRFDSDYAVSVRKGLTLKVGAEDKQNARAAGLSITGYMVAKGLEYIDESLSAAASTVSRR